MVWSSFLLFLFVEEWISVKGFEIMVSKFFSLFLDWCVFG